MLKVFVTSLATKKKRFPPKKGTWPLCLLFSSCLEPGAIPAFILSANWVSCWFCEVFVCRQPENDPNKIIVSRERVCGSLYYATGKYILPRTIHQVSQVAVVGAHVEYSIPGNIQHTQRTVHSCQSQHYSISLTPLYFFLLVDLNARSPSSGGGVSLHITTSSCWLHGEGEVVDISCGDRYHIFVWWWLVDSDLVPISMGVQSNVQDNIGRMKLPGYRSLVLPNQSSLTGGNHLHGKCIRCDVH